MMTTPDTDFLLDIDSPEALAWARAHSDATFEDLDADPLRGELAGDIRAALDTEDRIPYVVRRGDLLFNFWRDAQHPRGLWRTTTLDSYLSDAPQWRVLLDVDRLAGQEDENWVWKGARVRSPGHDRALVRLSRGGADAVVIREFDLINTTFVTEDPFLVEEAKTSVSWVDRDTIIIGTDLGEGSLTTSGYPAQARRWRRGEPLSAGEEIFAGEPTDVAVGAGADTTPGWERILVHRSLDFYRARRHVLTDAGLREIEVPDDCEISIHRQWLFLLPRQDWAGIPAGGLGVINFDRFLAGERDIRPVFTPGPGTALQDLNFTEHHLLLTLLDDVATEILVADLDDPTAPATRLDLPDLSTAHVVATAPLHGDEVWLSTSSFTRPATLLRIDLAVGREPTPARRAPLLFDATGLVTRQHWATSADGTRVPYFITGDFSVAGLRPTLVHAYGGFEVSLTPAHSPVRGLAWLEPGHLFVQANLRGGGEFGPEWHSQAVKRERMKVFEDHRAVLEDLLERGYTCPEMLGIRGGSNGGLLTSGALTQYPELFGAAVVQVPLTDMLRYHTWSAGASWMAEYGDPEDPGDRAVIERYSPLHNVASRQRRPYPPALVTTSTRDDRVHPAHARLFAEELARQGQPVDYYENIEGGHAGAADNSQVALVESLIHTWLRQRLVARVSSPGND